VNHPAATFPAADVGGDSPATTTSPAETVAITGATPQSSVVDFEVVTASDAAKPANLPARFLQHWDPQARTLTFGFGDGTTGVTVCSNREITDGDE
jgi:hypothetical protein